MQPPHIKAQYLELLQCAYLKCLHEFGKFMDKDIYQDHIRGLRTRANYEGIEQEAFDAWVGEVLSQAEKQTRRKVG